MISKFHSDPNFRWWNVFQTSSFILFSKLSCIEFEIMCSQSSDWNDLWVGNSAKIIMLNQKNYVVELWVGLVIIENQYWLMVLPILKIWNSMGKTIPYIVEKMFQTTNQNKFNLSNTCAFGNPKPTGHIQQGLEPPHCYIKVPSQQRSHSAFSKSMCAGVSLWQVQVANTRNVTSNHWIYSRELYSKGKRTPIFRAKNYVFFLHLCPFIQFCETSAQWIEG